MDSAELRKRIPHEEFDYQQLLDCLGEYRQPRAKISALLKSGIVTRVKKGIYVFGRDYRRGPVSREILANLLYGPSYLSLDYALQLHGLISERVEELTSVCLGRSRAFDTPLGRFSYHRLSLSRYQGGILRSRLPDGRAYLLATPEKALIDKLHEGRGLGLRSRAELREYLSDDLRIDFEDLGRLDAKLINEIAIRAKSRLARFLAKEVLAAHRKAE